MNKVILMGRLAQDPEVRYSQNGAEPLAIARYSLAVKRRFKKEGETDTDFIPCVAFGRSGEFAEKYLKKGMLIAISGRIQVSNWEDQQGQKRKTTEVIIEDQWFAESKSAYESRNATKSQSNGYEQNSFSAISENIDDDDLPF